MNAYTHLKIDVSALNYATVKSFNQTVLKKGDILFTSASETPDECALSSVIEEEIDDNVFLDDHLFGLRLKPDREGDNLPSFYQYVFRSYSFRKQIQKAVRGATRYYVSKSDFMRLTVPVPPLSIQKEIVETLDAFTDLTDALNKELEIRKKQYQFYIDEYFGNDLEEMIFQSSERGISIKTLSDLGTLTRGKRFVHADAVDDGIPCVRGIVYLLWNMDR
jgi:type I restriction enzyme S subunit